MQTCILYDCITKITHTQIAYIYIRTCVKYETLDEMGNKRQEKKPEQRKTKDQIIHVSM